MYNKAYLMAQIPFQTDSDAQETIRAIPIDRRKDKVAIGQSAGSKPCSAFSLVGVKEVMPGKSVGSIAQEFVKRMFQ